MTIVVDREEANWYPRIEKRKRSKFHMTTVPMTEPGPPTLTAFTLAQSRGVNVAPSALVTVARTQPPDPVTTAPTTPLWPESVLAGAFRTLDQDLTRECDHLHHAANLRPSTCRDPLHEQEDITSLFRALGTAAGHPELLSLVLYEDVSRAGHAIVARALSAAGLAAYGQVLCHCDVRTQRTLVRTLAQEIHR